MSLKKSVIQEALLQAKELENFAISQAKKTVEESLAPEIEKTVINALKEIESFNKESVQEEIKTEEVIKEDIKIEVAPEAELKINVDSNGSTIELGNNGVSSIENSNTETEMNTSPSPEDEIFEIEGLSEDDAIPTGAAPDVAPEGTGETASLNSIEAELQDMKSKIDSILSAVNPNAVSGSEGQVDVVDDGSASIPTPGLQNAPAAPSGGGIPPAQDNSVVTEDDIMFEIEDDVMESLNIVTEDNLEETENLEEIEIVDEDKDVQECGEEMEEMRGMSHAVERSAGNRQDFVKKKMQHTPVAHNMSEGEKKIKANNESIIDKLTKENKSLKESVNSLQKQKKEFESSFIELREQVQHMQVFNGKLAYANKLLGQSGITAKERERIAEEFDKAESVEEAKKLYNKLVSEMKNVPSTVDNTDDKLKLVKPLVVPATKTETIFESEERKRMKRLAGII